MLGIHWRYTFLVHVAHGGKLLLGENLNTPTFSPQEARRTPGANTAFRLLGHRRLSGLKVSTRSSSPSLMMQPALEAINRAVSAAVLHGWAVPGAAEASIRDPDSSPKGSSDSLHLPFLWSDDNFCSKNNCSSKQLADCNTYG